MEEDILNYSSTSMFRGTPCILFFAYNKDFTSISGNCLIKMQEIKSTIYFY